jgi:hypothetical protein
VNRRVSWDALPDGLRRRIEAEAGAFVREEPVATGHNCLVGMILHTTRDVFFVKGVPAGHARAVWNQANEAAVNPYLRPVAPALAFRIQTRDWDILGFEYLAGHRHADLSPGSPDLPAVAAALRSLAQIHAPDGVGLRRIEDRWRDYEDSLWLLAGPTLAHTDLHRHNIMIGNRARLVDWAWPTLAAPWIDTACVGLQMITAGHQPGAAEAWCQQLPAYAAASEQAIWTFVNAARGLWTDISTADPQPGKRQVTAAAERWAAHRRTLTHSTTKRHADQPGPLRTVPGHQFGPALWPGPEFGPTYSVVRPERERTRVNHSESDRYRRATHYRQQMIVFMRVE